MQLPGTDIQIVYDVMLCKGVFENTNTAAEITNRLMEKWGVTVEKLHEQALANTPRLRPLSIKREKYFTTDGLYPGKVYYLTNEKQFEGTAAILYPEARQYLAKEHPDGCCLIARDIHTWIVTDPHVKLDAPEMQLFIKDSERILSREEFLSDRIFWYKDGRFKIATPKSR